MAHNMKCSVNRSEKKGEKNFEMLAKIVENKSVQIVAENFLIFRQRKSGWTKRAHLTELQTFKGVLYLRGNSEIMGNKFFLANFSKIGCKLSFNDYFEL